MTTTELLLTDPTTVNTENSRWKIFIEDLRDIPLAKTYLKLALITIPASVLMFFHPYFETWMALLFVSVNMILHVGPYTLMLHNASHRKLFRRKFSFLNKAMTWILGPFFGQTPETYYAHHIGMHHVEGNLHGDLSSTMKYKRDSFIHFLRYYFRFLLFGIFELSYYHYKKGNKKLMRNAIVGELSWYALVIGLWQLNPSATVIFFVLPLIFARFGMMAGNWAQHAFISSEKPDDDYVSSLTCINTKYNHNCFNDGYHISHHLEPSRHWSLHPEHLKTHYEAYEKHGAIVFEKLDFFLVWLLLMFKQHKKLAKKMVTHKHLSLEEKVQLIKSRLVPIR